MQQQFLYEWTIYWSKVRHSHPKDWIQLQGFHVSTKTKERQIERGKEKRHNTLQLPVLGYIIQPTGSIAASHKQSCFLSFDATFCVERTPQTCNSLSSFMFASVSNLYFLRLLTRTTSLMFFLMPFNLTLLFLRCPLPLHHPLGLPLSRGLLVQEKIHQRQLES